MILDLIAETIIVTELENVLHLVVIDPTPESVERLLVANNRDFDGIQCLDNNAQNEPQILKQTRRFVTRVVARPDCVPNAWIVAAVTLK